MLASVQKLQVFGSQLDKSNWNDLSLWHTFVRDCINLEYERGHHSSGLWHSSCPLQLLQPHPGRHARHYVFYYLFRVSFQFIAFLAEAVVFVYLGLSIVYYYSEEVFSISFIGLEIVVCFLARFIAIFGLSTLFRICMKWKVTAN